MNQRAVAEFVISNRLARVCADHLYLLIGQIFRLLPSRRATAIHVDEIPDVSGEGEASRALIQLLAGGKTGTMYFDVAAQSIHLVHGSLEEMYVRTPNADASWRHLCNVAGIPFDHDAERCGMGITLVGRKWYRFLVNTGGDENRRSMAVEVVASGVGEVPFSEITRAYLFRHNGTQC